MSTFQQPDNYSLTFYDVLEYRFIYIKNIHIIYHYEPNCRKVELNDLLHDTYRGLKSKKKIRAAAALARLRSIFFSKTYMFKLFLSSLNISNKAFMPLCNGPKLLRRYH